MSYLLKEDGDKLLLETGDGILLEDLLSIIRYYTKGDYATLPTNNDNLESIYTDQEIIDVAINDTDRVSQIASSEYAIHQYENYVDAEANCVLRWKGRTTLSPATSTVYLQIYNVNTNTWEIKDSDSTSAVDTDFELTATIMDLTEYRDITDSITCRIYQLDS